MGFSGLSREQRAAASALIGPVRIVAGPGTGKTAVIAERFRRMVEAGADPRSILVMTFTERAAAAMRARIEGSIGEAPGDLQVGTFHAISQRWLREDGPKAGVPAGFRILAGADRWILMREVLWESGKEALIDVERPDDVVGQLLKVLERMKQELVPVSRLRSWARACHDPEARTWHLAAADVFDANQKECRAERLVDFDDLLTGAVRLLEGHSAVLARYRSQFPRLMVDEYQDTNLAQERMVELLAGPAGHVCVVGDDDQSIYRFRGASRANLERFAATFPSAPTLELGRNRRSTTAIVRAAARLISNNPDRLAKELTSRQTGPPVEIWDCPAGADEAGAIACEVRRHRDDGIPLREIAVLTRTNAMFGPILPALAAEGIPYQTWGARGFFERPEVKDAIAYLRLVSDPHDVVSLARLVGVRGAGLDPDVALEAVRAGRRIGLSALDALARLDGAGPWVEMVRDLVGLAGRMGMADLLFELLSRTRLAEPGPSVPAGERRRIQANLSKLSDLVSDFCERSRDQSLAAFLARLDLVLLSGAGEDTARVEELEEAVQVMTIHQAKGLEFEVVFVPGMVEGRLPQRGRAEGLEPPPEVVEAAPRREDVIAEERRLCYVAMTRAKSRLYLTWAATYDGPRRWRQSRFLDEIGADAGGRVRRVAVEPLAPAGAPRADLPAPGREAAPPPELSFSAIGTYRECPRRYWYRYLHRVPARETDEARYGTLVHDCLRLLGEARAAGGEVTAEAVTSAHREVWSKASLADPRRVPALSRLALTQLQRFREAGGFAGIPALVEHRFEVPMEGWILTGVIDRADRLPDPSGGWLLVDYKTGSPLPASKLRRDLQLALYALAARSGLAGPAEPIELEIAYLKTGRSVRIPAGHGLLEEAAEAGAGVAKGVTAGRYEPRPERRRCRLCAYRSACEEAL